MNDMMNDHDMSSLDSLRAQLNDIDDCIARLLNQRFTLIEQVARYKQHHAEQPIHDYRREQQICTRLTSAYPACAQQINDVYQEIFNQSKRMQQHLMKNHSKDDAHSNTLGGCQ